MFTKENRAAISYAYNFERRVKEIAEWYNLKTKAILGKYATNSPRVHYHIGPPPPVSKVSTIAELKEILHQAAERELELATKFWGGADIFTGKMILDAGCGFGGTCLYLAQEFGAQVTGITIASQHIDYARALVERAGASHLVTIKYADCHSYQTEKYYHVVVAVQAADGFDRHLWLTRMREIMTPDGILGIDGYFVTNLNLKSWFDHEMGSNIGTLNECIEAATMNGFVLEAMQDISNETAPFWRLCADFSSKLETNELGRHHTAKFHQIMGQYQETGQFQHMLLRFRYQINDSA